MLLQILQRTLQWVFAVFIVLLAAGIVQSRDRQMSRARAVSTCRAVGCLSP